MLKLIAEHLLLALRSIKAGLAFEETIGDALTIGVRIERAGRR